MYYIVYILRGRKNSERIYIGLTQNLNKRIKEHNKEKSQYSKTYGPWELQTYIVFQNKNQAKNFEEYLKSGSGFAFLKKRLI
jgi:predicted GIY-YIG superfamily endonuclease